MTPPHRLSPDARRRISDEPLHRITPDRLVQPVDVDLALPDEARAAVDALPGWYSHGRAAAVERIREGRRLGIEEFVVRISDSRPGPLQGRLDRQTAATALLVRETPPGTRCTVDPFSLALNPDGSWGIRADTGGIDVPATYALIRDTAAAVATTGAHGIVTLGRLPREVEHTRSGIASVDGSTRVYSFSQNSETSTAYVYLPPEHRDSGQKILPGNLPEMTLWALLDVFQGTQVSVTKPLENFHVTLDLVRHIQHRELLDRLFRTSLDDLVTPPGQASPPRPAEDVGQLLDALLADPDTLVKRLDRLTLYGYTVSGSTRALAHLAGADGTALARARLLESWTNWLAAADTPGSRIIDRNAAHYLADGVLGA
ncbi:hypothetical protein [Streptomyces capitiformicae]|uniref:Rhodanese domain-containing protein n=1 Tax=Streptomyces capitiformicae TaxID=2014920 RepID=A0A919GFG8_9ACTN|nr:hypothetical protein [Streptomyces capitiformicae]GHH83693.1 hypothetical protein GCM10017771_10930 [Streptomyces capitiformicae]